MKWIANLLKLVMTGAFTALLLSGCSSTIQPGPMTLRAKTPCVNRCLRTRSLCAQNCNARELVCKSDARQQARPQYQAYLDQQLKRRKRVTYTIDHFANFSSCTDSCACEKNYRWCANRCSG